MSLINLVKSPDWETADTNQDGFSLVLFVIPLELFSGDANFNELQTTYFYLNLIFRKI